MKYLSTVGMMLLMANAAMGEPDLACSEITSATSFGSVDGKVAYSFGTTVCNFGDAPVPYVATTDQHPLISQSIYRLKDHRIEQIGIGFVRHTNIPLSGNACGLGCTPGGLNELGPGCSDTNSTLINGNQGMMGPRTEVNAHTSVYPYPFTSIGQAGNSVYKRVQVELADVSDPDALYFVETQLIVPGETTPMARNNNVSYRQVVFAPGSATASLVGPTYSEQPAIYAWRDHGNGIGVPDPSVHIDEIEVVQGGLMRVASRVESDNGLYRYDYAIQNQNADRDIGMIEHSGGVTNDVHDLMFAAPSYHDDLDSDTDDQPWPIEFTRCGFLMTRHAVGFRQDPDANMIRWGTTYTFSFSTATEPQPEPSYFVLGYGATIDGVGPFHVIADAYVPIDPDIIVCDADLNSDGLLNFYDISLFLSNYTAGGDYNDDGQTNFFDVTQFLNDYLACCL